MKHQAGLSMMLFLFPFIFVPAHIQPQVQTASTQQTLNQHVADLQNNPNDTALRGKIIALVQTMRPSPAISEEARRHYVVGKTLADGAKKPEDFNEAIAEFKSALLAAPWWPEANRDYALTLEAAERFDEATAYVKLYMATNPGDERLRAAQDELYKIEARKKLAAQANAQAALEEQQRRQREEENSPQRKYANWLRGLNGARYIWSHPPQTITLEIRGNQVFYKCVADSMVFNETMNIQGNNFYSHGFTYTISDDGATITSVSPPDAYSHTVETSIYHRQ
jgi:hypothetical protein